MLGNYPNKALKSGAIYSDLVDFDFVEVKVLSRALSRSMNSSMIRRAFWVLAEPCAL